jgi:large subunit ribosomal protein L24
MSTRFKMKLRIGDEVKVLSGSDKGKTGKIVAVHLDTGKVTVEGINMVKKHLKPNREYPKGALLDKTVPLWASKVAILHPTDKTRTSRIGYGRNKDGAKIRTYRAANNQEIK